MKSFRRKAWATRPDIPNLSDKEIYHLYNNVLLAAENGNITPPSGQHANAGAFIINLSFDTLQKIYDKRGSDFGVSGNKNTQSLKKLDQEIKNEVGAPTTRHIEGTYHGKQATIHLTWLNNAIVTDTNGNVIAAYKPGVNQLMRFLASGNLN